MISIRSSQAPFFERLQGSFGVPFVLVSILTWSQGLEVSILLSDLKAGKREKQQNRGRI